jgi:hypothetical protein
MKLYGLDKGDYFKLTISASPVFRVVHMGSSGIICCDKRGRLHKFNGLTPVIRAKEVDMNAS